jgi:predicted dinucleotide-binding enzyme
MIGETRPSRDVSRIAVLGAGHVGPVVARMALAAGYAVSISASGDPASIELITQVLAPGVEPLRAAEAIAPADVVFLSIPLHRFASFDPELVVGKLVVDTMNYWPPVDGRQELFEDPRYSSSEIVQRRLADSLVVKSFNHIGYHEMEEDRRPPGSPERRSLGVAGDDPAAVATVAELVERLGYDAVRLDSLAEGRLLGPGGPVFGVALGRAEFEDAVHSAAA